MFTAPRPRFWLIAAAGAGVLLAAGCSSASNVAGSRQASTSHPLSASAAIQLAAAHARLATSFTGTVNVNGSGTDAITLAGTVSEQVQPTLLVEADFPTVTASGVSLADGMNEIVTSKALYLRMSALSSMTGKPWVKVSLSELGGSSLTRALQEAQQGNPLLQTQLLADATGVRTVGTSTIDGVRVTEYAGSYSIASALAKLPASTRAAEQRAAAAGFTTASFKIWLDDQQQVRKLIVTEPGTTETATVTMTVTSVNQPVTVQLPAASQVATLPASALTSDS